MPLPKYAAEGINEALRELKEELGFRASHHPAHQALVRVLHRAGNPIDSCACDQCRFGAPSFTRATLRGSQGRADAWNHAKDLQEAGRASGRPDDVDGSWSA